MIPYSRPNALIYIPYPRVQLLENHTLRSGTYPYSPYSSYMAVPPPPPDYAVITGRHDLPSDARAFSLTSYET